MCSAEKKRQIVRQLFEVGCLKCGQFILKGGETSPVYVDLRIMVSYPELIKSFADLVWEEKNAKALSCEGICGVPYAALPVATAIAVKNNFPMILKRKEAKAYGTKKLLEGSYKAGQKILIIDDVIASGGSVFDTVEVLRKEGLIVTDCIVIVNRQQGGQEILPKYGVTLHSLFTLAEIVDEALQQNLITETVAQTIHNYLQKNKYIEINNVALKAILPFSQRVSGRCPNPILKKLLSIMEWKESNLCVAADVRTSADLVRVVDAVGPYICVLKTHADVVDDFSDSTISQLLALAQKHDFLIMEDRKFADIGNTVALQYTCSPYKIRDWADIITVHSVPGEGVLLALKSATNGNKACILVAEMSCEGALTDEQYRDCTLKMAERHKDFVIGFVSQSRFGNNDFVYMSPGVNLSDKGDLLGQQYRSPEDAVKKSLIDIIIVGRGIIEAENVAEAAELYQQRAFAAYKETLQ